MSVLSSLGGSVFFLRESRNESYKRRYINVKKDALTLLLKMAFLQSTWPLGSVANERPLVQDWLLVTWTSFDAVPAALCCLVALGILLSRKRWNTLARRRPPRSFSMSRTITHTQLSGRRDSISSWEDLHDKVNHSTWDCGEHEVY